MPATSQENNSSKISLLLYFVLGAIGALSPLAIDMYIPTMPTIARDLGVSASAVQITLTAYTSGFAIGQLLYGPLADSVGRRPVLLLGTLLFSIAAAISANVTDIHQLTYIRMAQGFSGAAAVVVIQAVVRDMFEREDFSRVMSFITLIIIMAPLISPMIGAHLAMWFGWRSIFWVLMGFALLVVAIVYWKIPETLAVEAKQPFKLRIILRNYIRLIRNKIAVGLLLSGAFSFAGMFVFLTAGSFVYIDIFGVSGTNFSYLYSLNIVSLILMTTINGRLVKKLGLHTMLRFGLSVQLVAGIGLFSCWVFNLGLWGIVPFVVLYIGGLSTIGSNTMALLLSHYPTMAGTAASLSGTLRFGVGSLIGVIVSMMPSYATWPMLIAMSSCAALSSLFYWVLGKKVQ